MTTKAPIKTEVLEESSKRFGDGMSAFMDVSTQYIGYLRSRPTVQLTMREDESGVADFEEKESTTGGGSFGGFDIPGFGRRPRRRKPRKPSRRRRNQRSSKAARKRYQRRYGAKAARNRFKGGVRGKLPRIPRGGVRGGLLGVALAGLEFGSRKMEGQTNLQAGVGTGASVAGGLVGGAAGAKGGAVIGGVIGGILGSVIPGAGTLAGAAIGAKLGSVAGGLAGGFLGADAAAGAADTITGVNKLVPDGEPTPGFAEGRVVNAPTKALIGEGGESELVLPMSKIGAAMNAVYREGGSVLVGTTLAFLAAIPASAATASLKSDISRLGGLFGIAPASAKTIPSGGLKEIPSKDDKVQVGAPNVTTSPTTTAQNLQTTDTESTNRTTTSSSATAQSNMFSSKPEEGMSDVKLEERPQSETQMTMGTSGDFVVTSTMGNRSFALSPGMHMGVDIAGPEGSPYYAFTDGEISGSGWDGGYGNWVAWVDDTGVEHFYAHMPAPTKYKVGDKVSAGTVIGAMGNTGRSSGPHLHWETSTKRGDTGMSKNAVLSRFNPLDRYNAGAPMGVTMDSGVQPTTAEDGKGGGLTPPQMSSTKKIVTETPVQQIDRVNEVAVPTPVPVVQPQYIPMPTAPRVVEKEQKKVFVVDVFGKGTR